MRAETARCLGCGASIVEPNKCIGCGLCTTKCAFDEMCIRDSGFLVRVGSGLVVGLAFGVLVSCLVFGRRSIIAGILFAFGF